MRSDDHGKTWKDVSSEISLPKGIRHGATRNFALSGMACSYLKVMSPLIVHALLGSFGVFTRFKERFYPAQHPLLRTLWDACEMQGLMAAVRKKFRSFPGISGFQTIKYLV